MYYTYSITFEIVVHIDIPPSLQDETKDFFADAKSFQFFVHNNAHYGENKSIPLS